MNVEAHPSTRTWLLLAIALFLLQAMPFFAHRWVTDESWYAAPGFSIAQGHGTADPAIGPNDMENHFDARPPGTALVIAAMFRLLGVSPVTARLGSLLAGLLTLGVTWRLASQLLGRTAAIVATLVVASDTLLVAASRTARPEALATMSVWLAALAMLTYFESRRLAWALAAGLLMALATAFHITILGFIVSFGLLAIVFESRAAGRLRITAAAVYSAGYFAGLIPFAVWILTAPIGKQAFAAEYLARSANEGVAAKLLHELGRYKDVFGVGMLHVHGLQALPVRLPVPLCFLFASFVLWRYRRAWFYVELVMLVPTLLWWVDTVNKTSRYVALLAPLMALVIGAALFVAPAKSPLRRVTLAFAALVIAMQVGGNLYLLNSARKADYEGLAAKLRAVIPAGEPVYATMTFWMAFHDRPFVSYERTTIPQAAGDLHIRYFILGDRMMQEGLDTDPDFYRQLDQDASALITHAAPVAEFIDPYYGDLHVYRVQ